MREADHAGHRVVLLRGRRRHRLGSEVADELRQRQPGVQVGVLLDGQRPRGVAEQQGISGRPAALFGSGQRVAADEASLRSEVLRQLQHRGFQRPDVGQDRAWIQMGAERFERGTDLGQRHRHDDEVRVAHRVCVGGGDREAGRPRPAGGLGVDVVADCGQASLRDGMQEGAADQPQAKHGDPVERRSHALEPIPRLASTSPRPPHVSGS